MTEEKEPMLAAYRDRTLSPEAAAQLVKLLTDTIGRVHSGEPLPEGDAVALLKKIRTESVQADLGPILRDWCDQRKDKVAACYLLTTTESVSVFVLTTSVQYDFDFGKEIAALERRLAPLPELFVFASQIPACPPDSLSAFFDPAQATKITG